MFLSVGNLLANRGELLRFAPLRVARLEFVVEIHCAAPRTLDSGFGIPLKSNPNCRR
jgi:hypothetical protein